MEHKVSQAMATVRRILDTTRNPVVPGSAERAHTYEDKYRLAELIAAQGIEGVTCALDVLGVSATTRSKMKEWANDNKTVCIACEATQTCAPRRIVKRDEKSTKTTEYTWTDVNDKTHIKQTTTTTVIEYFFTLQFQYRVFVFAGADPKATEWCIDVIPSRTIEYELMGVTPKLPKPEMKTHPRLLCELTWLVKTMSINSDGSGDVNFHIDRESTSCKTPRRNREVARMISETRNLSTFSDSMRRKISDLVTILTANKSSVSGADKGQGHGLDLESLSCEGIFVPVLPLFEDDILTANKSSVSGADKGQGHGLDLKSLSCEGIFVPVLPLFEDGVTAAIVESSGDDGASEADVVPFAYVSKFVAEQRRSIEDKLVVLAKGFPAEADMRKFLTVAEAKMAIICDHIGHVCSNICQSFDYIEKLLYDQLNAAIGKVIMPKDFDEYMSHHYKRFFAPEYAMHPFTYAVRRPDHYPEGTVSIERTDEATPQPISTMMRHVDRDDCAAVTCRLSASLTVNFKCDRHIHGFMQHKFAGHSATQLSLVARARQFSSFMLVVGTMSGANEFKATDAIIIKDKDELIVKLLLEDLPSAQAFKDAIDSMSPEQQRFAKQFRQMQLEGSMFAMVIVQLKPQLEKLLNLPHDSLTKELRLTQDLLTLFIEYQIPSDLLCYSASEDVGDTPVNHVRRHVDAINAIIAEQKNQVVADARVQAEYERPDLFQKSKESAPPRMTMESAAPMMRMMASAAAPMMARSAPTPVPPSAPKPAPAPTASIASTTMGQQVTPVVQDTPVVQQQTEQQATSDGAGGNDDTDVTKIPGMLDERLLAFKENFLVSSTMKTGAWNRKTKKNILAAAVTSILQQSERATERDKAFDLLDALTKCGGLDVDDASLHVVVATTHAFSKSLVDSVIQDNMNPIEKVECSALLLASVIHGCNLGNLVLPAVRKNIQTFSPLLGIEAE